MRCDECGRPILNAELWKITNNPDAPIARSMGVLCWDCRQKAARAAEVRHDLLSANQPQAGAPAQARSA